MTSTPQSLADLLEIPDKYTKIVIGEKCLFYDSFVDEQFNLYWGRIILFTTTILRALFSNVVRRWNF